MTQTRAHSWIKEKCLNPAPVPFHFVYSVSNRSWVFPTYRRAEETKPDWQTCPRPISGQCRGSHEQYTTVSHCLQRTVYTGHWEHSPIQGTKSTSHTCCPFSSSCGDLHSTVSQLLGTGMWGPCCIYLVGLNSPMSRRIWFKNQRDTAKDNLEIFCLLTRGVSILPCKWNASWITFKCKGLLFKSVPHTSKFSQTYLILMITSSAYVKKNSVCQKWILEILNQ